MPLFTYVVSYKAETSAAQGSHSNFAGFAATWAGSLPASALHTVSPVLRKELIALALRATFVAVPNTKHVWRAEFALGNSPLTVHAVQTER